MKSLLYKLSIVSLVAFGVLFCGCYDIISGTFIIDILIEDDDFTTRHDFYYYYVDLSTNEDWQDHEEDIDNIDVVGFELWIDNPGEATTFDIWIDDASADADSTLADVQTNATRVLRGLAIASGNDQFVSYGTSLGHIENIETLRTLVRSGEFHYYGLAVGSTTDEYHVDSARVAITLSASGS